MRFYKSADERSLRKTNYASKQRLTDILVSQKKNNGIPEIEGGTRITEAFMIMFTMDQVLETRKIWGSRNEERASQTKEGVSAKMQRNGERWAH